MNDLLFLSAFFNSVLWNMGWPVGLLPNADSGVPCPQFRCKRRSSRSKFL